MGKIITFTGPSGVGKTTIVRRLTEMENFDLVLSHTTREPLDSDLHGEYKHVDSNFFADQMSRFMWINSYAGEQYGSMFRSVYEAQERDSFSIMSVIPNVLPTLHHYIKKDLFSFYVTADSEMIKHRLEESLNAIDIPRRREADKFYQQQMQIIDVPLRKIKNNGLLEDTIHQVLGYLR